MKTVLVIHGSFGKPFENWFPWLDARLSEKNTLCFVPHFPTPNYQNYDNWKKLLDFYYDLNLINSESILVGHSSGAAFLAKYLIDKSTKVKALITVAGFNNFFSGDEDFDAINKHFFVPDSDLSKVSNCADTRHCFLSPTDPYLPFEKLQDFSNSINATPHVIESGGHFNAAAGYSQFSEMLDLIQEL